MHFILVIEDQINQVKIMKEEKGSNAYVLALSNKGFLHTKRIQYNYINNDLKKYEEKIFNCCIDSEDNSVWSLDYHYPYVIVGGNHKCILLFNINDNPEEGDNMIKNSVIYTGNDHNVPYVCFSPNGDFIACASIDSELKIWDVYTRKLQVKIKNKNKEWAWGVKFIPKQNFSIKTNVKNEQNDPISKCLRSIFGIGMYESPSNLSDLNDFDILDVKFANEDINNDSEELLPSKENIRNNLLQYFMGCTYQLNFCLNCIQFDGDNLSSKNIGQINLMQNYFRYKYLEVSDYYNPHNHFVIQSYMGFSRYEYYFTSDVLNMIIIGNRAGDIQFYEMELEVNQSNVVTIKNKPIAIIDCKARIAGMKVIDNQNYCEIYILKLNGVLEIYKLAKLNN